jgi:hypothetical protein
MKYENIELLNEFKVYQVNHLDFHLMMLMKVAAEFSSKVVEVIVKVHYYVMVVVMVEM